MRGRGDRWRARPVSSAALKAMILVVPLAAGVGAAMLLSRMLPRPAGAAVLGWWGLLFLASFLVATLFDRVARRLLPLAVLMKLTLLFPDQAPSRFAVARKAGSVRNLEERIRHAREHGVEDDPARAAETILSLVAALSAHDRRTRGHSERVRAFTDLLADALKLPEADRDRLRWSALLHDIGKIEVPAKILNKPGKPDPHEWESLKRHPSEGARMAAPLLAWLGEWGLAIEQHHERWDGSGYPNGLAGPAISRGARMLSVTDSFDTMTAARSYKKAMVAAAAREELARCAGTQFDPTMVRTFLNVSLGRVAWTLGPLSWLAQLPFVGPRMAGAQVIAGTSTATAIVPAAVGVMALGASGLAKVPAVGAKRPAAVVVMEQATAPDFGSADVQVEPTQTSNKDGKSGDKQDDPSPGGKQGQGTGPTEIPNPGTQGGGGVGASDQDQPEGGGGGPDSGDGGNDHDSGGSGSGGSGSGGSGSGGSGSGGSGSGGSGSDSSGPGSGGSGSDSSGPGSGGSGSDSSGPGSGGSGSGGSGSGGSGSGDEGSGGGGLVDDLVDTVDDLLGGLFGRGH